MTESAPAVGGLGILDDEVRDAFDQRVRGVFQQLPHATKGLRLALAAPLSRLRLPTNDPSRQDDGSGRRPRPACEGLAGCLRIPPVARFTIAISSPARTAGRKPNASLPGPCRCRGMRRRSDNPPETFAPGRVFNFFCTLDERDTVIVCSSIPVATAKIFGSKMMSSAGKLISSVKMRRRGCKFRLFVRLYPLVRFHRTPSRRPRRHNA